MTRTNAATLDLSSQLRVSVMRLARRLRNERADTSLSFTQISALSVLHCDGPLTPGELAARERVQPPSMTRTLAALEQQGLVVRTPHPTDRRQVLVAATGAAQALLHEDRRHREAWLTR